ncbi:MAG: ABC transporter permease [Nocardiopsaceae bacterium]|nr:ABC transporter permease [Nocardiopsaceae bacterium]
MTTVSFPSARMPELEDLGRLDGRPRWSYVTGRLLRMPIFLCGAAILGFWIITALTSQWWVPYSPFATSPLHSFAGPSGAHWLGTDQLGRDVLSRTLAGASSVLTIAPVATFLAVLGGTTLGLMAGYYGGIFEDVLMRGVDAFLAFPGIIIAVFVLGLVGPSQLVITVLIAVFYTPIIARTVRSAVLGARESGYVEAARLRSERGPYIMVVELLPNVQGPILVEGTLRLGYAVFTAATLSFLGLGLQPPSADWGLAVATSRGFIESAPLTVLAPAIALASLVVSVNLVADGLRKAFQA